jgi:hypothetical protein
MLMICGDGNGDGSLTPKEIQSVKDKVFEKGAVDDGKKSSTTPKQRP